MKRLHRLSSQLLTYFHTQLFITLISLPLLLSWGLPISLASIVGNLLFAPVLSAVLLLASLIFFGELFSLPTTLLTLIFEWITHGWFSLLTRGSPSWLWSCSSALFYSRGAYPCPTICNCTLQVAKKQTPQYWSTFCSPYRRLPQPQLVHRYRDCHYSLSFKRAYTRKRSAYCSHRSWGPFPKGAPHWVATTLIPTLRKKGISHTSYPCLSHSINNYISVYCLLNRCLTRFPPLYTCF